MDGCLTFFFHDDFQKVEVLFWWKSVLDHATFGVVSNIYFLSLTLQRLPPMVSFRDVIFPKLTFKLMACPYLLLHTYVYIFHGITIFILIVSQLHIHLWVCLQDLYFLPLIYLSKFMWYNIYLQYLSWLLWLYNKVDFFLQNVLPVPCP